MAATAGIGSFFSPLALIKRHLSLPINRRNMNPRVSVRVRLPIQSSLRSDVADAAIGFDAVSEMELRRKGFMGLRKTKLVCTVGPSCCSDEELERLAMGGMNVARLNMCHNTREWHQATIRAIQRLNREKGFCVSVMIDTEGSQMYVIDHKSDSSVRAEVFLILFPRFEMIVLGNVDNLLNKQAIL